MIGIYCRISREKEEGTDRSINDQKQHGIELANKLNSAYKVYIDEGLSGTLPIDKRHGLNSLIDDIMNKVVTTVYVYDQSRLERSQEARFAIKKIFNQYKIKLYTNTGLESDSVESEFQGDLMSVINSFYVKLTSKKIKSVLKRNAEEGRRFSILPYGYSSGDDKKLIVNEQESLVIKRIYELSLSGVGTNKIAEILNSENVPTRYNIMKGTLTTLDRYDKRKTTRSKSDIKWSGNSIRGILKNTHYKGERKWGENYYPCPLIIDEVLWQKVNDNLVKNRNNSGRNVEHKYLLKGLLRCEKCGRNYYGKTRVSKKDNFYMCSSKRIKHENCGNRSINIDRLDDAIWLGLVTDSQLYTTFRNYFESKVNNDSLIQLKTELDELNYQLKSTEVYIQRLIQVVLESEGLITDEDVKQKMMSYKEEKATLLIKIDNLKEQIAFFDTLETEKTKILTTLSNLVLNSSFNDKKQLLNDFVSNIQVMHLPEKRTHRITVNYKLHGIDSFVFEFIKNYKYITFDRLQFYPTDEGLKYAVMNGTIELTEVEK